MPLGRIQGEISRQTFPSPTVRWTPEKLNVNDQLSISQTEIPTSLQEAWNTAHQDLLERLESSVTLNKFRDARLVAWTSSADDSLTLDIEVQGDFIAQWVRVRHVTLLTKLGGPQSGASNPPTSANTDSSQAPGARDVIQ